MSQSLQLLLYDQEKVVNCLTCHKEVNVELIPFGDGYVAICPLCSELAYNEK